MKDINIWRVHTNTDIEEGIKETVGDYCIRNNCICLGWSLKGVNIYDDSQDMNKIRKYISKGSEDESYDKYERFVIDNKIYSGKVNDNIYRLKNDIKPYDLIWMRNKGIYYLGIVGENSRYFYNSDDIVMQMDATNQRTDIKWIEVGDESEVPGVVTTAFIMGRTLQRINQEGVLQFSQHIVNEECIKNGKKPIYYIEKIEEGFKGFFNLISPADCEDLVCMWLYKKYGYITIPSTNKNSTPLYECVLINPKKRRDKEVYIQVKKGEDNLYKSNYTHLGGEVFLFTTRGKIYLNKNASVEDYNTTIYNQEDKLTTVIYSIDVSVIYEFAMDNSNDSYLPNKIIKWRDIFRSYK